MPNTFFGLTIGTTGLYGANIGINTTAHNISNAETEGYTRQVVSTRADSALKANGTYGMIGTGVSVTGINQIRDNYYDEKYRTNNSITGYYDTQDYYMKSIENYFNEIQLEGFNSNYNLFCDALQELSKDPSSLAVRTQANSYAQNLCDYINSLNTGLEQIQDDLNFEIKTMSDKINSYAAQIAGLTKQINTLEITGGVANDLRDQRNLLLDGLSNIVDINVTEKTLGSDESGVTEFTVRIGDSLLVDTFDFNTLKVVPRPERINQSDIDGIYELEWTSSETTLDGFRCGGKLQSLYEVRDGNSENYFHGIGDASNKTVTVRKTGIDDVEKLHIPETGIITVGSKGYVYNSFKATEKTNADGETVLEYEFTLNEKLLKNYSDTQISIGQSISFKGIPYYMQQLDEFTRTFSREFNDLHTSGYDLKNDPGLDYFNCKDRVSGENFVFQYSPSEQPDGAVKIPIKTGDYEVDEDKNYGSYYFMTAKTFSVTKEVYHDPNKLVTATDMTNGKENSDLVTEYLNLRNDKDMFLQGTPQGFLQALVAELGVDAHKSGNFSKNQQDILAAIQNQRLSISGVDMDEEAMNLVRYQNSYNLAAKVISTMNEMYDRLINYMGT